MRDSGDGDALLVMIDLDNTLGNRTAAVQEWTEQFCTQRDLPAGAAEWILEQDNDGYSARSQVFAAIKKRFELADPVEQILEAYQSKIVQLAEPTMGAIECLKDLRSAGHTVAIVSNGSTRQQHGKIDAMGLRPLVDAVIVSGDLDIKKPDARIFEAAAAATGQSLVGAWMVGDSALHDVVGARGVGAKTAWIHRGRAWSEPSCEPTVMIDDLTQLADAIQVGS